MAIGIEDIAPLLPADWPGTKLPEMPGDLARRVTGGFGGDVPAVVRPWDKESLAFGFLMENQYWQVMRIWSRPWW